MYNTSSIKERRVIIKNAVIFNIKPNRFNLYNISSIKESRWPQISFI